MDAVAEDRPSSGQRRERGGRSARRELRSHGREGLGRPYIVRNIPTYDILSEENLFASRRPPTASWPRSASSSATIRRRSTIGSGPAPRSTACW